MTTDELLRLIGNHEDNFVERKSEGLRDAEMRQTVSAFANAVPAGREGVLFIGIHDNSEPIEHVTVNYDREKNRPMLMVRFPRG